MVIDHKVVIFSLSFIATKLAKYLKSLKVIKITVKLLLIQLPAQFSKISGFVIKLLRN